MKADAIT